VAIICYGSRGDYNPMKYTAVLLKEVGYNPAIQARTTIEQGVGDLHALEADSIGESNYGISMTYGFIIEMSKLYRTSFCLYRKQTSGRSNPGLEGSSPLAIFERDRKGSSPWSSVADLTAMYAPNINKPWMDTIAQLFSFISCETQKRKMRTRILHMLTPKHTK
jgi:hypothetical protein